MLLRRLFPRFMSRHVRRALRGAVMVEYAFLLVAVGVPAVAGLTAGGKSMYDGYKRGRDSMLSPFP
jgi:Flp pilus assembly pilin Flp